MMTSAFPSEKPNNLSRRSEASSMLRGIQKSTLKKGLALQIVGLLLMSTGCLHPSKVGPQSLPRDRVNYSLSLADSWKEQILLNIVKIRYVDTPMFVDVGSIVASYTLTLGATAEATIAPGGTNSGVLNGSVNYSNSPTITYTPLTGSAYVKSLMTPLPASTVFAALQTGLPADALLLSSIASINGLQNQQLGWHRSDLPMPASSGCDCCSTRCSFPERSGFTPKRVPRSRR